MPPRHGGVDQDALAENFGIFLHDHRIGPIGNGRAGKNPDGLSWSDDSVEACPGRGFTDQCKRRGQGGHVGRADRITIHGRAIERGLRQVRGQIFRKHAAVGFRDRHALDVERC